MIELTMTRGDTRMLPIVVVDEDGAPYDLTGATLWWSAKASVADVTYAIQKTTTAGITVTNALGGLATATISPSDTSSFANVQTALLWDLQLKTTTGAIYTIATGTLTIRPDITTETA